MTNVRKFPQENTEGYIKHLEEEFKTLLDSYGQSVDENRRLKKKVRQLESHIVKLSFQLNQ